MRGEPSKLGAIMVPVRNGPYTETSGKKDCFDWDLLRALYMGADFPPPPSELFLLGLRRLNEVSDLALEQIETIEKNPGNTIAVSILEQSDILMDQIMSLVPDVAPIVRWFQTEKIR